MVVKVLGKGCSKCRLLASRLEKVRSKYELDFKLEKVTDMEEILAYGVILTPALVINEVVKSAGRIPGEEDLLEFLRECT